MRRAAGLLFLFALAFLAARAHAQVTVHNLRTWQAPDHTRLVFDLSGPLEHRLFTLKDPDRLVVDLADAAMPDLSSLDLAGPVVAGIRSAQHERDLRVVIDLKAAVDPRAFVLRPYEQYGHRLVIDLYDTRVKDEPSARAPQPARRASRDLVIAIDAGHGGEDPGAIGYRKTREKEVTLAIARALYRQVNKTPGMRAVLVRDGDYYIPLRERIEKARRHDPDAFVSIHADSVPGKRRVRGSSVYALSERGATREAAYLAARENAADLIGGVSLDDKDDVLSKVLVDMTQTGTISASLDLAMDILTAMKRVGPVHSERVGQAAFMVLRSPYIPSVLIETAFISNPEEEKRLRNPRDQEKIAAGILEGLKRAAPRLLARRTPPPMQAAAAAEARHHLVERGETLEQIASRYGVSIDALRFFNNLGNTQLRAGARLRIPGSESEI